MGSYLVLADWISIHAPARGATDRRRTGRYQGYFNPRSREGSVHRELPFQPVRFISIHAPARGATRHGRGGDRGIPHFNPRSREGSDAVGAPTNCSSVYFNPRSREGSDDYDSRSMGTEGYFNPRSREGSDVKIGVKSINAGISIHAPARGATLLALT